MRPVLTDNPPTHGRRFKESSLAQAWLVLVLAVCFGISLAAVQVTLSAKIARNKLNETLEKIPELVGGSPGTARAAAQRSALLIVPGNFSVTSNSKTDTYSLYQVSREQQLAGWVIKAGGQGYADKIELLVGLDPQVASVTGLFVLDQKETPGLGNKIALPGWRRQFVGKSTAHPLVVVKGGPVAANAIDAVTGATISSRSVARIVNRVMAAARGRLKTGSVNLTQRQP